MQNPLENVPRPLPPNTMILVQPVGTLPTDESYSHTIYGTWNVSAIRRAIASGGLRPEGHNIVINDSVRNGVAQIDTNPEQIDRLTEQDLLTPCMTVMIDDYGIIIDGAHRIKRLIRDGSGHFPSWVMQGADVEEYRIHFYETNDAGEPTEMDPEKVAKIGWGTFPQHTEAYVRRRT